MTDVKRHFIGRTGRTSRQVIMLSGHVIPSGTAMIVDRVSSTGLVSLVNRRLGFALSGVPINEGLFDMDPREDDETAS